VMRVAIEGSEGDSQQLKKNRRHHRQLLSERSRAARSRPAQRSLSQADTDL
jgi:hypothetical protein